MRLRDRWSRGVPQRCGQCAAEAPADARWCGSCGAALGRLADELERIAAQPDEVTAAADGRGGRALAAATVAAVLLGLLALQAAQPEPVVPAGYSSRGDGARTGVVSVATPPAPTGVAWRTPIELPPLLTVGADVLDTTTTADGRELVVVLDPAESGQRVTAHDATDGSIVTTTMLPLGNQPYATSVSDGLLAHRDLQTVTLVDLATGDRRWTVDLRLRDATVSTPHGIVGVSAETDAPTLVLLDAEDGSERWATPLGDGRVLHILPTRDVVTVVLESDGGQTRTLAAYEPTSGALRWSTSTMGNAGDLPSVLRFPAGQPMTDGQRVLWFGSEDVVVVEPADGAITRLDLPEGLRPATGDLDGDLALVTDAEDRLLAFDRATGGVLWEAAVGQPFFGVATSGGLVALTAESTETTLLDAATGAAVTRTPPGRGRMGVVVTASGEVAQRGSDAEIEVAGAAGLRWRAPTVAVHLPDLATDDGAVAVTTPSGVEVLDVLDGTRRFAHEAFQAPLVTAGTLTAPALESGRVTVAPPLTQPNDRGGLLSLFADTGIVDWARRDDRVVPRGTPVQDRDLYVLPVGSQVLGFQRSNGVRSLVVETSIARSDVAAANDWIVAVDGPRDAGDVWVGRRSTRSMVFRAPIRACAPPVIHDELALVSTNLGDLIARRLEDGEQPWGERARGSACRPLTISGDTLVALVDDSELLGVGLDDGDTTWRASLGATAAGAPVAAGDLVLVPTLAGTIEAWTVGAETPTWTVDVGAVPAGSVAVDGDTLLVLTRTGELVALR